MTALIICALVAAAAGVGSGYLIGWARGFDEACASSSRFWSGEIDRMIDEFRDARKTNEEPK